MRDSHSESRNMKFKNENFLTEIFVPVTSLFPYNYLNRVKIDPSSHRLGRELALILLIFTLSSLLIFCFINHTIRTVSSVSVLNSFLRLLYPFFLPTSYRPSEHKAEASHRSSEDIHHPSTQIFNKTSTASAGHAAAALLGAVCRPCCA